MFVVKLLLQRFSSHSFLRTSSQVLLRKFCFADFTIFTILLRRSSSFFSSLHRLEPVIKGDPLEPEQLPELFWER